MALADLCYRAVRPGLMRLEPECAHGLTIAALRLGRRSGLLDPTHSGDDARLAVRVLGLRFANPLGLAAGFDKNAQVPDAMLALGFGFAEVGTITPLPQPGNPQPRIFRLREDQGLINRLGFNNEGLEPALARLKARRALPGIVGGNVGANKDSADRIADYETGVRAVAPYVRYLTINISSPNTPGLRALQSRDALEELVSRSLAARDQAGLKGRTPPPMLIKVAPDLTQADVRDITQVARTQGIAGLIIGNTTINRPQTLRSAHAQEAGGLSGQPLHDLATRTLRAFAREAGVTPGAPPAPGELVLIGAGGIASGAQAYARLRSGARLLQLYSALVYEGPGLVARIKAELLACMTRDGVHDLSEIIATDLD